MRNRSVFFLAGCGLFLLFIIFSYIVHKDVLTQFDFNTTVHVQDMVSRRFDIPFSWFSFFGQFEEMTVALIVILLLFRRLWGAVVALSLFFVFHLIEIFGKVFVDHPPPPEFMLRTQRMVDFPQFTVREESSYPSGHSGRTLFVSLLLIYFIYQSKFSLPVKLVLIAAILGYDVVMIISRIYLGEHWTSDVIGGVILGTAFSLVSLAFLLQTPVKKS